MKRNFQKWITTAVIILINFFLWVIPSNVAYLVAQNRDVLLGRYGMTRFTWMLVLIPVSIAALYLTWSNEKNERQRQFKVIAISISVILAFLVVDVFARLIDRQRYVKQQTYYHRVPNTVDHGTSHDIPEKAFVYPTIRPGYPDIEYTLTVDKRGFRNTTDFNEYDVVILGDSFTEGSNVSDDQIWPALFAQKAKQTVYNLGMSAGHPGTYLETLKKFGPELSPKTVVCLLYEGNDFRDANFERQDSLGRRLGNYFKCSPLRLALEEFLTSLFGSERVNQSNSIQTNAISWLPVAIPEGSDAKYYTFKVKRLLVHFVSRDDFLQSEGCQKSFEALRQIKKICDEKNIRFIVVYAPDKPHTILPLIKDKVTPGQLHEFLSLRQEDLPVAGELMDKVIACTQVKESVIKDFCRQQFIEFVSLTEPLRQKISDGQQAYFTYDQHWTPVGHEVAADTLCRYLSFSVTTEGERDSAKKQDD